MLKPSSYLWEIYEAQVNHSSGQEKVIPIQNAGEAVISLGAMEEFVS